MSLQKQLNALFRAPKPRAPDVHRKARQEAKTLAKTHGIEIEKIGSGFNVWPPKGSVNDPFDGDHYAQDWAQVLLMVKEYAQR